MVWHGFNSKVMAYKPLPKTKLYNYGAPPSAQYSHVITPIPPGSPKYGTLCGGIRPGEIGDVGDIGEGGDLGDLAPGSDRPSPDGYAPVKDPMVPTLSMYLCTVLNKYIYIYTYI